jgi:hypothetical protein
MPMLRMKTKKPMKPMLEILEITGDAGLSSPNHPASALTSRPSYPIHRGNARVVRMATAYSGTTTPQFRKSPVALVTRVMAAAASGACSAGLASTSGCCRRTGRPCTATPEFARSSPRPVDVVAADLCEGRWPQFQPTDPGMWPLSYAVVSSSTSMT